jgi:acyl-CoA reductase-like NAD-dependent aldehyde dehydrogenase
MLVVPIRQDALDGPHGHEKLAPIFSLVMVHNEEDGIRARQRLLSTQGRGHTAVIHTQDREMTERYGREIEASRILVSRSSSQGCIGIGTGLTRSFTLGCGTFGGNSTTDNVTYSHLINVKRLALGT